MTTTTTVMNRFTAKLAVNVISRGIVATEMVDRLAGDTAARRSSSTAGRPSRPHG